MKCFVWKTTGVFLLSAFWQATQSSLYAAAPIAPPQAAGYSLAFSDEFDSLSLSPNEQGAYTWYDGVYFYNNPAPLANISAANSILSLTWTQAQGQNQASYDTSIETFSTNSLSYHTWRYGYFEVRMKWDVVVGAWPAIWMVPIQGDSSAPETGEFDIFEGQGDQPHTFFGTIHDWKNGISTSNNPNSANLPSVDFSQYHTYGLLWTAPAKSGQLGQVTWYLDNQALLTAPTPAIVDTQDYFLILAAQEGPNWTAGSMTGVTVSQMSVNVDWVHVWQQASGAVPNMKLTKSVDKATAVSGAILTYTIAYQNTGTASAINFVISDPVPAGATVLSGSITNGGSLSNGIVRWTLPTVAAGASGSVGFQVRAP